MKIRFILSAFCMAVLFGACSDKDSDGVAETGNHKAVYLKLNTSSTRAEEPSATGTTAPLLSAIIYFMDGSGDPIVEVARRVGAGADVTIAELEDGYEFMNIPSTVTQVYVVGNYNSSNAAGASASFPEARGTLFSTLEAVQLQIQQVAYPRLADGTTATQLLTIMDGRALVQKYANLPTGWHGETQLTDEDLYADVTIAPLNSRLEIEEITYTGTTYSSFTLEGIYINNYYEMMPLNLDYTTSATYAPMNHGSNQLLYDVTSNQFAYTNLSVLFDTVFVDAPVTGGTITLTPETTGDVWAYHLFGNSSPVPHIVLKLTDVVLAANGNNIGTRYVTVTGYLEFGVEVSTFERNVIYKIENLIFTDAGIAPVPEPEQVGIWVHVEVTPWQTTIVTPVI